jgi:hypothetical protein
VDSVFLLVVIAVILLLAVILAYLSGSIKRNYRDEALNGLKRTSVLTGSVVTEEDMAYLPLPVQKYLRHAGIVGREKLLNLRITFEGEMRPDPGRGWAKVNAVQYSFFDKPTRLFFMRIRMFGVPLVGLHSYTAELARMLIKALGLITVTDSKGPEMRVSDTTTMFNDMCMMAPATLIDKSIEWESIDALTVKATYELYDTRVSATLYFNEKGELINFISDDRYIIGLDNVPKKGRWSTPAGEYRDYGGTRLASSAEATWLLPEGDYCYGKFTIASVEYNCKGLK